MEVSEPRRVWFRLCGHSWSVQHRVVTLFGFGWRDIPDGLDKTQVVEPVISQASFDRRSRRGDSRVAFACFSSTHFDYVECKENVG